MQEIGKIREVREYMDKPLSVSRREKTIGQGGQEDQQIVNFLGVQCGSLTARAVVGSLCHIDIATQQAWQIVVNDKVALRVLGIPKLWLGITRHVKLNRFTQVVELTVVKEMLSQSHITQAGHFEGTTQVSAGAQVGTHGSAQALVKERYIVVTHNRTVTRNAQTVVTEICEQSSWGVVGFSARMARGAIAFV